MVCGKCISVCPNLANDIVDGTHNYDRKLCVGCGECIRVCPNDAFKIAGYEIKATDLLLKIVRDRVFYERTGGGVTFTGGEPLAQTDELIEIVQLSKQAGIHTAIETSLMAPAKAIESVADLLDLWICDIKTFSPGKHKQCTGADNEVILRNFRRLCEQSPEKLWVRFPLIPGFNDSKEELEGIVGLLKCKPFGRVEILPYHNWGSDKYAALGMKYVPDNIQPPESERVEKLRNLFENNGVVNIFRVN